MEYTVKLRSPYEFERAVRPYQTGDDIDMSANCDELGSGRDAKWLEQTSILNDDNPPELVFADEDGNETVVRLLMASGVKCAEDEGEFPDNSFIKCVYWQNQESALGDEFFGDEEPIEIEGDVDPAKITFTYQNVRNEDGSLIPVLKRGSVKYGDVEMCFSTPEGDGSVEQVRVFTGGTLRVFGGHDVESLKSMRRGSAKIGCLAAPFLLLALLWFVGHVLGGITEDWTPILNKCSIALRNQYEAIKERRLKAKIAYEEEQFAKEEREHQKAREASSQKSLQMEQKDAEDRKFKMNARIREFAEKEATTLWATLQTLTSEVETQGRKIAELRQVLQEFNRDPAGDEDFKRICEMKTSLEKSVFEIRAKLEDAYIASKKFEATPGRKDYEEIRRKAIEDGVQEADAAIQRFKLMRESK